MITLETNAEYLYPGEPWLRNPTSLGNIAPRIPLRFRPMSENLHFNMDCMMVHIFVIGTIPLATPVDLYFLCDHDGTWASMVVHSAVKSPFLDWMIAGTATSAASDPLMLSSTERGDLEEIRRITKLPYRALQKILGTSHTTLIGLLNDPQRTPRYALAERIRQLVRLVRLLDDARQGDVSSLHAALYTRIAGHSAADLFAARDYQGAARTAQAVLSSSTSHSPEGPPPDVSIATVRHPETTYEI